MKTDISIRRLHAADYDEALDLLNLTFSMTIKPHDFLKVMPTALGRDEAHMNKYLAIEREGKLRALLGVYPLPTVICGRKLLFSTVGNVATHPYETGKGYMSLLLDRAMKELDAIGADASRLGGLRQRYSRYGYEPVGSQYSFTMTPHNLRTRRPDAWSSDITFRPMTAHDDLLLSAAHALQKKAVMHADRGSDADFLRTLITWESRPLAALKDGRLMGYLVVTAGGDGVSECIAENESAAFDILCAWLAQSGAPKIHIAVEPWRPQLTRLLCPLCESWAIESPSQFYLRSWDRLTDALLALKCSCTALPDGEIVLGIHGWGSLHMQVTGTQTLSEKTDREPDFCLTPAEAAHLIAGPLPPTAVFEVPADLQALLSAWFPLPLSWCTLDRA